MNVLIKFPCRGRPEKFKDTFSKYLSLSSKKHNLQFILTFDENDSLMNNDNIKEFLKPHLQYTEVNYGNSKNKIEAVNANMDNKVFDILILASDDMIPICPEYDDVIATDISENFPDLDGSVQYYNPMWEDKLDVCCNMGYKYYKRFNYIYYPGYKTIYCDNEFTYVKNALNKNKYFSNKQLFIHNFITNDDTASKNWHFNNEDEKLYNERKARNFDVSCLQ